jgi:aldehyde dehydrogenase (NAD+)
VKTYRMYIDGRWAEAASGATYELPNPATEEIVGVAPDADRDDMARAISAARRAFDDGPWPRSSVIDRSRVLHAIADGLERRKEEFRALLVAAHGAEHISHQVQVDMPVEQLRTYAELVRSFPFEESLAAVCMDTHIGPQVVTTMAHHQPVGVCGLIPTWNFPLYVTVQKIGPALAAGCTMVVKPSPWGPLVDLLLAEVVEEANLPPGVFNVVTGQAPELGSDLVDSPLVDKISFTGSSATGKAILQAAGPTMKRLHLELGGKSAMIVLEDAELGMGSMSASAPAFFHAGQGCALTTRVLVHRKVHDELVAKMVDFVANVVTVGDPADPGVMMGPLMRGRQRERVEAYIASGQTEGAELVTGGGRPAHLERGFFLEPTIFTGVRNDMKIAREEIFGPVVSVMPFDDEDEAVRIANDSSFGLFGGIQTRNCLRAVAIAKRLRCGGVSINSASDLIHAPFGGFKDSGLGREGGNYGLREFTETQAITWPA